jgi:hypothetical protein
VAQLHHQEIGMNIAIVGGVERNQSELDLLVRRAGHQLEYHGGHIGGRGAEGLRAAIERADVVVLQTVVNSHGSMYLTKKLARQLGKPMMVVRTCGPSRLLALIDLLQRGSAFTRAAALDSCA